MPNPKPQAPQESAPAEPLYPVIESFVERASREEVGELFARIKDGLFNLKGPKVEQSKKVQTALERTEELLNFLIGIREKMEAERKGGGKGR